MKTHIFSFFIKYKLYKGKITSQRVKQIIQSLGFTVMEYNIFINNKTYKIMEALNVLNYCETKDCFTYFNDDGNKYVFIKDGLPANDEVILLLHEAGHIYNEHFTTKGLIHNTSIQQEKQANIFYMALQFFNLICRAAVPVICAALLVCVVYYIDNGTKPEHKESTQKETINVTAEDTQPELSGDIVYYSEGGEVYHLYKDCYHLANSDIISGTVKQSGKKRCCLTCENRLEDGE